MGGGDGIHAPERNSSSLDDMEVHCGRAIGEEHTVSGRTRNDLSLKTQNNILTQAFPNISSISNICGGHISNIAQRAS